MNTITKGQYDLLKKEIIDNLIGTQIGGKMRRFISVNSINSWMNKAGITLESENKVSDNALSNVIGYDADKLNAITTEDLYRNYFTKKD